MSQYINKIDVIAEIEKRMQELHSTNTHQIQVGEKMNRDVLMWLNALTWVKKILNTIEVKDVDLEKELNAWRHNHFQGKRDKDASGEYLERVSQLDLAKHFFELGLLTSKPITAEDRGTAEEIIINLKRVEQDYRIDLTKEIKWVRNKVHKGE